MEGRYNVRSPAVKRLMKEAQELSEPTDQYFAQPLEDNLFEWHFTVRGPADSDFQNGIYHGRIILPVDYPMKPPSIMWLTPNGRFETNKKICLSISGHHPESWQPSWSIRTALLAIIGFMPTHPGGAIGSLDYKPDERKVLAKKSRSWKCPTCGDVSHILLEVSSDSQSASKEAKELAAQISFQGEKPKNKPDEKSAEDAEKKKDNPSSKNESKVATTTTSSSGADATGNAPDSADAKQIPSSSPIMACGANSTPPNPTAATTTPGAPFLGTPASLLPSGAPLPPWNAGPPLQPYSYYMGQNAPHSMSAMPLRFPYPPSYYTAASSFYPTGCALPPGVGMFPCPLPPPPPYLSHVPASSTHTTVSNTITHGTRAQTSVSYTQPPLTSPSIASQPQGGVSNEKSVSRSDQKQAESKTEKADQKQVMNELLMKVRRVGSDEKNVTSQERKESPVDVDKEMHANTETPEECGEVMDKELSHFQGQNITIETCTDNEVSKSLRKTNSKGDITNSEALPSDMENSEIGVPPLEASESEQRSVLEKSTCNSTPELEKLKGKQLLHKGLRHRQSATASVNTNTEVDDEGATGLDPSVAVLRQRIEAESGDSRPGNFVRPREQAPRVRQINQETVGAAPLGQNSYDVTFFLMVIFFISAVGIFLNRLLRLYWAVDLP